MSYAYLGFGDVSADQTKTIQTQVNTVLSKNGYNPIAVDGKWGPATCGALTATVNMDGGDAMAQALTVIGTLDTVCTGNQKAPTKKGSTPKVSSVSVKPATSSSSSSSGSFLGLPMQTVAIIALGAVGVVTVMGKKKG